MKRSCSYFFMFCIYGLLLCSCSGRKFARYNNVNFQKEILSREIKSSKAITTALENKNVAKKSYSETLTQGQTTIVSSISQQRNGVSKEISGQARLHQKNVAAYKTPNQKPVSDFPIDLKKHNNILWKLGGIICMTGMAFLFLGLSILLKVNKGPYTVWIVGIFIGLGLMVISLPLLLIGASTASGKNNNQEQNKTE